MMEDERLFAFCVPEDGVDCNLLKSWLASMPPSSKTLEVFRSPWLNPVPPGPCEDLIVFKLTYQTKDEG